MVRLEKIIKMGGENGKEIKSINVPFKCVNFELSREQQIDEMKLYGNDSGCSGYKKMGCYNCNGFNRECDTYSMHPLIKYMIKKEFLQ